MTMPLRPVWTSVTVTVFKPWFGGSRWQPWRWVAKSANGRVLATSAESYTNKADAVDAIWTLFGAGAFVRLRNDDGTFYTLRSGVTE